MRRDMPAKEELNLQVVEAFQVCIFDEQVEKCTSKTLGKGMKSSSLRSSEAINL